MFTLRTFLLFVFVALATTPARAEQDGQRSITPRQLRTMFDGWANEWRLVTEITSPGARGSWDGYRPGEVWQAERVGPLRIHTFREGEPWLELSFTEEGEYRASAFVDGDIAKGPEPIPDFVEPMMIREFQVNSPDRWSFRAEGRVRGREVRTKFVRDGDVFLFSVEREGDGIRRVVVHRLAD
jgi:hypothetical protein